VDQAISSLSNLLLAVVVANVSSVSEFGTFGIGFSVYLLTQGVARSLAGEPILLYSREWMDGGHSHARQMRGGAVWGGSLIAAAASAVLLAVSLLAPIANRSILLMFAAVLPALIGVDLMRYLAFADLRARRAAGIDITWLIVQLLITAPLLLTAQQSPALLILAWGMGALATCGVNVASRNVRISGIESLVSFARAHGKASRTFLGEYLTLSGVQQALVYVTLVVAGLSAVASLRGAQTILGPATVLTGSANLFLLPHARTLRSESATKLVQFLAAAGGAMAGINLLAAGLILSVPDALGEQLLGASWHPARSVALPLACALAVNSLSYGAAAGLRVSGLARVSLRIRLVFVLPSLAGIAFGAAHAGAQGAVTGLLIISSIQSTVWWLNFLKSALR